MLFRRHPMPLSKTDHVDHTCRYIHSLQLWLLSIAPCAKPKLPHTNRQYYLRPFSYYFPEKQSPRWLVWVGMGQWTFQVPNHLFSTSAQHYLDSVRKYTIHELLIGITNHPNHSFNIPTSVTSQTILYTKRVYLLRRSFYENYILINPSISPFYS